MAKVRLEPHPRVSRVPQNEQPVPVMDLGCPRRPCRSHRLTGRGGSGGNANPNLKPSRQTALSLLHPPGSQVTPQKSHSSSRSSRSSTRFSTGFSHLPVACSPPKSPGVQRGGKAGTGFPAGREGGVHLGRGLRSNPQLQSHQRQGGGKRNTQTPRAPEKSFHNVPEGRSRDPGTPSGLQGSEPAHNQARAPSPGPPLSHAIRPDTVSMTCSPCLTAVT